MAAAKLRDIIQPNVKGDIFLVPIESDQSINGLTIWALHVPLPTSYDAKQ